MTKTAKYILGLAAPHSLVMSYYRVRQAKMQRQRLANQKLLSNASANHSSYSYTAAMEYLSQLGVPSEHLAGGSIPESSLEFIGAHLPAPSPNGQPIRALHIGNFVGASLAYITAACVTRNPRSTVVAIDPNIKHRGVENPQQLVTKLIGHFGLQSNVLLICGYSLRKNLGDDGYIFNPADADVASRFADDTAPENALQQLLDLAGPGSFDFALIDGNHSADYLWCELQLVLPLLRPNGLLALDDVAESWPEVQEVFRRLSTVKGRLRNSMCDGRVGLWWPDAR